MKALLTLVMAVVLSPVFANATEDKKEDATAPATSEEVKKEDAAPAAAK